jgi:enoyl-CoA hydratase/carnithine racemase
VPVIARVQGMATAAGCQLVAQCDLAVAATDASFASAASTYGLFCSTPSVPLAAQHAGQAGDGDAAHRRLHLGRRGACAWPGEPRGAARSAGRRSRKIAAVAIAKPREALAMGKALFYQQRETGIEAAYQLAGQSMACNMAHAVAQEGVQAFIEKRKPEWPVPAP